MIKGIILAAICVLVWGGSFVNTRALLGDFSALEIQVIRFAVAVLVLTVVERSAKLERPQLGGGWKETRLYMGLGLFGVAVYQLLENCAIHYTNASNVAILVSSNPVVTALLAWAFGVSRRPRWIFFVGFLVAITGVAMVSLNGLSEFHFRPAGDLMAIGAMLSWGFYSILVGKMKGGSQVYVMRRAFGWSLAMLLPFVLFGLTEAGQTAMSGSFAVTLDPAKNAARFATLSNLLHLGILGVLASAGCFVFWNQACARLGLVRCTLCIYLMPVVTVLTAFVYLGERMTAVSALGAVLTFIGVFVSTPSSKR